VRPGEKLYEELLFDSETAVPTDHPKVLRAKNGALPLGLSRVIEMLVERSQQGRPDDEIRELLVRLVPEFKMATSAAPEAIGAART
jgi:FlaA1/EpsC-like NDP-sugar epimerase